MLTQESMQTHNIIDEKQFMQYVHVHIKQRHEIYTHNKKVDEPKSGEPPVGLKLAADN